MVREIKPMVLLGEGEHKEKVVKDFGPAGSLERLDGEAARAKLAESDPKEIVPPAELKTPPKRASSADGSDLAPTVAG